MKTIRLLLTTALTAMIAAGTYAQNTFFPAKAGMELIYANKDARGRVDSHSRQAIKSVEGSGSNMTISYVFESLDRNQKSLTDPPLEIPCTVIVKDDVVILDMNRFFADQQKDQQLKIEITGVPMELPNNMQPGQSLKDAEITMTIDMVITSIRTVMKMTNGKCLAIESVTVPAGTFTCHKITQTVTTTVMRREVVTRTDSWYAPGIGTVKTETYDNRDRLQSSTELIQVL